MPPFPSPGSWRPNLPWEGPPVPVFLSSSEGDPASLLANPHQGEPAPKESGAAAEGMVLIMRPKGKKPTWLQPYQELLGEASAKAAEETRDLKGAERVRRKAAIVGEEIRRRAGLEAD